MNVRCALLGHRWREVWRGWGASKGRPILVCLRCKENGWAL